MKLFTLGYFLVFLHDFSLGVTVITKLGLIEGTEYVTNNSRVVNAFLGVPFAKPPVGEYRFEDPVPVEKWEGTWKATSSSPDCLQSKSENQPFIGLEDCLYLDIYTPTSFNGSALPVLVNIHPGAFRIGGGSSWKPYYLLDNDNLVFVTFNYRLGPLGFLSTEDAVVPGNSGLKDQTLALKWVQENIEAFGGDKNKVTISGASAGGVSVHYHYLSPLSRGLFSKGISSSGCALNHWGFTESPLQKTRLLADFVGCPTVNNEIMVRCMKEKPGRQLLLGSDLFMPWLRNPFAPFGPVIEKGGKNPFLAEHPYRLLSEGRAFEGPWFAGINTEDGLYPGFKFIESKRLTKELNDNWQDIAPLLLDYNFTLSQNDFVNVNNEIKMFYFDNEEISVSNGAKSIRMLTDRMFKSDMSIAARLQASAIKSSVFFYVFGYRGKISFSDKFLPSKRNAGACHTDDVSYVYGFERESRFSFEEESDRLMALTMQQLWLSFIKTGIPSAPGVVWNPVSQNTPVSSNILTNLYIKSPSDIKMVDTFDFGNSTFWSSLGLTENQNYITNDKTTNSGRVKCISRVVLIAIFLFILLTPKTP